MRTRSHSKDGARSNRSRRPSGDYTPHTSRSRKLSGESLSRATSASPTAQRRMDVSPTLSELSDDVSAGGGSFNSPRGGDSHASPEPLSPDERESQASGPRYSTPSRRQRTSSMGHGSTKRETPPPRLMCASGKSPPSVGRSEAKLPAGMAVARLMRQVPRQVSLRTLLVEQGIVDKDAGTHPFARATTTGTTAGTDTSNAQDSPASSPAATTKCTSKNDSMHGSPRAGHTHKEPSSAPATATAAVQYSHRAVAQEQPQVLPPGVAYVAIIVLACLPFLTPPPLRYVVEEHEDHRVLEVNAAPLLRARVVMPASLRVFGEKRARVDPATDAARRRRVFNMFQGPTFHVVCSLPAGSKLLQACSLPLYFPICSRQSRRDLPPGLRGQGRRARRKQRSGLRSTTRTLGPVSRETIPLQCCIGTLTNVKSQHLRVWGRGKAETQISGTTQVWLLGTVLPHHSTHPKLASHLASATRSDRLQFVGARVGAEGGSQWCALSLAIQAPLLLKSPLGRCPPAPRLFAHAARLGTLRWQQIRLNRYHIRQPAAGKARRREERGRHRLRTVLQTRVYRSHGPSVPAASLTRMHRVEPSLDALLRALNDALIAHPALPQPRRCCPPRRRHTSRGP